MVQNNALLLNVIGTINGNIWQLRKLMGTGNEKKSNDRNDENFKNEERPFTAHAF